VTRDRIEELEEEVRQLRALLAERMMQEWPVEWRLTPIQGRFLSLIARCAGDIATSRYVYSALYGDRDPGDQPDNNVLAVYASQCRKKLPADQAARLVTHHGVGWSWTKKDPAAE
jgi:DNA-binding response OmpR family regulator